ncbi:cytochrome-c peroxidase [Dyella silvatica]|uniref:cytochrome-c peroxidase n=1 Tax=Dyella silvatica TaxID=2992128 RepID=UPI00225ABEE5|nr:cytochrome c peroxidase [Dyella silvatica]
MRRWRQPCASRRLALLLSCVLVASVAWASEPQAVSLLPGAAATPVVQWIGATAQVSAKADASSAVFQPDPVLAELGRRVFNDARLSEPAGTACARCHDPARAFSPNLVANGVPPGGRPGHFSQRNAPSLLYVRYVPQRYFYQDDDAPYASPFGGLFADGRANNLAEQIRGPLFDPDEMNNASPASLLRKINRTELAPALAARFGPAVQRDPQQLLQALGAVMQAYLQSDEMAPFSSRFDDYLRHRTPLSAQEMRGLALFKDPDKGNCASCHTLSDTASRPERSLFTDFGYDAIAVPRNPALPANRDAAHFDHGLCTTAQRLHWPEPGQWCGYLRTPSLRNVAVRQSFMHNGVFRTLRDAVAFYNTRSIDPRRWYHGGVEFDDVAPIYRAYINVNTMPMNRRPGMSPALSETEIDDIVAFLRTLTDAPYRPAMPADASWPTSHALP